MSPTEFSNYIKQRAIQQQQSHHNNHNGHNNVNASNGTSTNGHMNPHGPVSPARSLSPNPLSIAIMNGGASNGTNVSARNRSSYGGGHNNFDNPSFDGHNYMNASMYSPPYGRNSLYDSSYGGGSPSISTTTTNTTNSMGNGTSSFYSNGWNSSAIGNGATNKYSPYIDTGNYYGLSNGQQAPTQQQQTANTLGAIGSASSHINGMTNGHHQTLESNLNAGNINLLVAN